MLRLFTIFIGLLLLMGDTHSCFASTLHFYVATNGNDKWSGTIGSPSRDGSDGPFQTVAHAQAVVRADHSTHPITVEIRGGRYLLTQPLVFGPDDSGTSTKPVVYEAYHGEHPVFCGGVPIKNWKIDSHGYWEFDLQDVKSGAWNFEQLFVDGVRRYRPRLPSVGYYQIAGTLPPTPAAEGHGCDQFQFQPGQIKSTWQNLGDIEILAFHNWSMARLRIAQVDDSQHIVRTTGPTFATVDWASLNVGKRFMIDNVREALSKPGQWYLDRPSGVLTYIPQPGEEPESADIIAPLVSQIVLLEGDPVHHKWVQYLTLRGLSFDYANWVNPPQGHDYPQSDIDIDAAISAQGARECRIENCEVGHVGGYAIDLGAGCQNDTLEHCNLTDLGAGGVKIGGTDMPDDPELVAANNTIDNCDIYGCGRLHPAGTGVWIGQSHGNKITHNAIHDLYYSSITIGWVWGFTKSLAYDNVVSDNDLYDIGQGVLSDMGGIYTLGVSPGTVEDHNRIHDVRSFSYGGWGIYYDEGTSDILTTRNLVYDTSASGFFHHYGANNLLRDNIFAFGNEAQLMRSNDELHHAFTLEHNIVVSGGSPILGDDWSGNDYSLDHNDYWILGGAPVMMSGHSFADWQASGKDQHSVTADPGFADVLARDFHITDPSAAKKIGFSIFDVDHFGPTYRIDDLPLAPCVPSSLDRLSKVATVSESDCKLSPETVAQSLHFLYAHWSRLYTIFMPTSL